MFFEPDFYVKACRDGARFKTWNGVIEVRYPLIGRLNLPSGKIIACDPMFFACPDQLAYTFTAPHGKHPLHLAIFKMPTGHEAVAFANLLFRDVPLSRWEMAVLPGQDVDQLSEGTFFGYPVDSASAGFVSPEACAAFAQARGDDPFAEPSMKRLLAEQWVELTADVSAELNAFAFSSGGGDGHYPSYVSYDAAGEIASFFTEFGLLAELDEFLE